MKDSIRKYLTGFVSAVIVLAIAGTLMARLTGTQPARTAPDTWCVGASGAEVCVDASGNVIPTTNNDTTLGTSSLRWSNIYSVGTNLSGTTALSGATTLSGAVTITGTVVIPQVDIAVATPTVAGQLIRTAAQVVYIATNTTDLAGWVKVGAQ